MIEQCEKCALFNSLGCPYGYELASILEDCDEFRASEALEDNKPNYYPEPCDFCTNGRTHEDLSDDNDYGSHTIDVFSTEDRGYRLMLTYGWGKPLRIETDVWNDKRKEWSLHVLQYYPKFCPECGRRLSEYGAEGDILQNTFPHRKEKK